ncbi:cytochrome c oxidase accessory protein FixG [Thiohalospira halophila DSM 15071]|uniref:Cytochrome c oxidase accessory protein FixG n=1 Tax=Thiohalospira halophila DSM 15071 TaxID=1123397 RepID=A0A1I1T5B5_9GAMM|nr:cytochrome c oxidase accessory protein CcoG [Thiohalospira halophila]SFD53875.1 cytochrome c oxidase accessory protein FixG [Thiohalospira halophila DSM 15071]
MATETAQEGAYQARIPIHPRSVKGRFRNLKWGILILAYGVYFLLPWLRWDRTTGPSQAVQFDIPGRQFYLFDLTVFAQDIFWLAGLLIIGAWLLFFVTGIAGRVFCGYFCFQTLWTDVYILIERLVQGERPKRLRLSKGPWNSEKITKYGITHILWLAMAFLTGLTFTMYWTDAPTLVQQFFTGQAPYPAYFTTGFLTLTTYIMAGHAREQVCTYMCPYARFQSAMFNMDTLIVSYDTNRGEREQGRHKVAKGLKTPEERREKGYGDCIDCGYCVQVCPVGIDIRNGLQYQCISCALCIDACDNIMDQMGYPRGLVRYTSERELEGGKTHFLKPKNFGYAAAILVASGALIYSIATRAPMEFFAAQVRQPLSVTLSDGRIQNRYNLKVSNKTTEPIDYRIRLEGLQGASMDLGGYETITVEAERSSRVQAKVRVEPDLLTGEQTHFRFVMDPVNDAYQPLKAEATFHGPD